MTPNIILYFHLPNFHVWKSALFFTWYAGTHPLHRRKLDTFYTNDMGETNHALHKKPNEKRIRVSWEVLNKILLWNAVAWLT